MDGMVLVTGASGFVGSRVVEELLGRGFRVRGTGRRVRPSVLPEAAEYRRADLCDETAVAALCEGVGAVVHVAAKAGVWGPEAEYRRSNVEATRLLLAGAVSVGAQAFVFTSTPSVVYTGHAIRGGNESMPYGTSFPCAYPATKAEAEKLVLERDGAAGMRTLALRPHLVWGPGDPHLFPRVFERVRAGRLRQVGAGENRVDLTHIDNVAKGHADALEALLAGTGGGNPYFLTQDEPVSLWPFVNRVLAGTGFPVVEKRVSLSKALWAGRVCETVWRLLRRGDDPPMTRFVAVELAEDHWFSSARAKEVLGYRPTVDMETGLRGYLDFLSGKNERRDESA